jgi:small subunit ribosomal protein S3
MGNKVQSNLYRLGITKDWNSRWFTSKKRWKEYLEQDDKIRSFIQKKLPKSGISQIDIERSPKLMNVIIHTSRAGMVIGRGGSGVEQLKNDLK